jgi:hypothetical protein
MKLGNLKPVKRPSFLRRLFSTINAKLAGKYVNDIHPGFMRYLEKNNFVTASIWRDVQAKEFRKIMKIIDSDKYRKFFYNAIKYNPAKREVPVIIKPWYVWLWNKITYELSKVYVFVFDREIYKKIRNFEKVSSEYGDLAARIDKYIAETTFDERLSRMHALEVISYKSFQDDFDILMRRIPNDVVEERSNRFVNEKPKEYLTTFGSPLEMKRNPPLDVADLIQMAKK